MSIEITRNVSQADLAAWRRKLGKGTERAIAQGSSKIRGEAAVASSPEHGWQPPLASASETYKRMMDLIMSQKPEAALYETVRTLRVTNPGLIDHLTDAEAVAELKRSIDEKVRRAVHDSYTDIIKRPDKLKTIISYGT